MLTHAELGLLILSKFGFIKYGRQRHHKGFCKTKLLQHSRPACPAGPAHYIKSTAICWRSLTGLRFSI